MPTDFEAIVADLDAHYPELMATKTANGVEVTGVHVVRSTSQEHEWGRFDIRICLPEEFPGELPEVYEVGGKIPIDVNAFKLPDGRCFINVPAAIYMRLGKTFALSEFILGPLADYFRGQAIVAVGGPWPTNMHLVGATGVVQFWQAEFPLSSNADIACILQRASQVNIPHELPDEDVPVSFGQLKPYAEVHANLQERFPRAILAQDAHTLGQCEPWDVQPDLV